MWAANDKHTHIGVAQDYEYFNKKEKCNKIAKRYYAFPNTECGKDKLFKALGTNHSLYELLAEGVPVKPYFDLEMEYDDFDPDDMVENLNLFIDFLIQEIQAVFGHRLFSSDFLIQDSCRKDKLSYHLIINRKLCFGNVANHKVFTKYLHARFSNPQNEWETDAFNQLSWTAHRKSGEDKRFIFDAVPYSNNQCFRLVGQGKLGAQYLLKNITDDVFGIRDNLVRLYDGPQGRTVLDVDPLYILTDKLIVAKNPKSKGEGKGTGKGGAKREKTLEECKRDVDACMDSFTPTGRTLQQTKKLTDDEVEKLPPVSRYVHLIPNNYQPYTIWRNIGMAIRGAGGTLDLFEEWSRLGDEDEGSLESKWKGFNNHGAGHTYGLPLLKRLAKQANPEYFQRKNELLSMFFSLNTEGIEVIRETSEFVSQEGTAFEEDINHQAKMLILHAYLGRGKSTAIKRILPQHPSYLFLSPHQTFARFISAEMGCACYLDARDRAGDQMVISLESLLKIPEGKEYDLLVFDEC